jgi:WD40 repeat protein
MNQTYPLINSCQESIIDDTKRTTVQLPHKDQIKSIHFVIKERKYLSVSKDGDICIWSTNFRLAKSFYLRDLGFNNSSWILDTFYINDQNRLVVVTDDRRYIFITITDPSLYIYEVMSIKPRVILRLHSLEFNPLCISYSSTPT